MVRRADRRASSGASCYGYEEKDTGALFAVDTYNIASDDFYTVVSFGVGI